jgi:hypothetical protein
MVGTAQAADFAIFMRKIGYSVGLEDLVSRAGDFGRAYAADESFRYADWVRLVRESWNLKSEHVADVFASLRIVRIINRDPIPGPIGEALGILARRLDGERYERAVRFLILLAVIYHDGDIFLNALASSFRREEFRGSLLQAIRAKRETLFSVFGSYQEKEAVFHAVAIDRQRTNRGSSGGKTLDSLAKGRPLSDRTRSLGLPQKLDLTRLDEPSEDYLDKVLVTRRGWADALGLYNDALTDRGIGLLSRLRESGFGHGAGPFLVWPTAFEIARARFNLGTFSEIPIKSTLDFMQAVAEGLRDRAQKAAIGSPTGKSFVSYVAAVYDDFRSLSQNRSMIRNELPLEVLGATWYAEGEANGTVMALEQSLLDAAAPEEGLIIRTSQTIELAITVKRREGISAH